MTPTHDNANRRARLIADLHRFADHLEAHPHVPIPRLGPVRVHVHPLYDTLAGTEAEAIAELERLADLMDTPVTVRHGHHVACKEFGLITYELVVVTDAAMGVAEARRSYENVIVLDAVPPSPDGV
ncbi:hypothetical protein HII36_28610 [Nonomuraea sp. NN258]|uniref:hypothetical protein n=1 Tax=Nonomuraea antri TaxID=2730852 RepID=UPI001568F187|nr:hypothetical protein [Nonomuraea antri]NRQ35766.1 hypothetical protein [Nonomuraea antri]